jgi:hypothetical protein
MRPSMSNLLVTVGTIASGGRVFLGLLAAGRGARTIAGSSSYTALATPTCGERVWHRAHRSVAVVAHDYDRERLDAAAGCEFVDDRLRQFE